MMLSFKITTETTGEKFQGFSCRRHQIAAADEDDGDEGRRLVLTVLSSVVMATQLSGHVMEFGRQ